ncbi:MAG: phosphotransferase [Ilumatobacteraceae bacterium]
MEPDEEVLRGGVANAGAVVRVGSHVLRPSNPHTGSIHELLRYVRDTGFGGASEPIGVDPDGRERLVYIPGDVPIPPYPAWVQSDESLASIARLLRRYHDAAAGFVPTATDSWSNEMADPGGTGALILCHNDVCLENVVFHEGIAAGLLDFDFAAPGRPLYDIAQMARMCVPIDDDESAARVGWRPADRPSRLRLVADAYGLPPGRGELFDILVATVERGGEFVKRRVDQGDANFIEMWEAMGGSARFDRRRAWFASHAEVLRAALG